MAGELLRCSTRRSPSLSELTKLLAEIAVEQYLHELEAIDKVTANEHVHRAETKEKKLQ